MKRVNLKVDKKRNIKKIAITSDPAVEGESFHYFSKEERHLYFSKPNEKRLMTGLIMRPDKDIPRIDDETKERYMVKFSKDVVREASQLYLIDNNQHNVNKEHEEDVNGMTLVQSYIIDDPNMNNAKALGFTDIQEGDWWGTFYIEDDDVLNNIIKSGMVSGFSVEGSFLTESIELFNTHEFAKNPPIHPNCKCTISDGRWIYSHDEGSPCEMCMNARDKYNSRNFSKEDDLIKHLQDNLSIDKIDELLKSIENAYKNK